MRYESKTTKLKRNFLEIPRPLYIIFFLGLQNNVMIRITFSAFDFVERERERDHSK